MSQTTNPNAGERVTFWELFKRHPIVKIPIIQRDYVQGRPSAVEVRTEFLKALQAALSKPEGDPSLPLDLDFVYGSVENSDRNAFSPLDGQQRLTTLFLLHWYLAWKDGRGDDFAAFIKTDEHSRLSYAVRPSSHEFFDALVSWYPDTIPGEVLSPSDSITDQPWFFRSWKLDPTILSSLTLLDAIHGVFGATDGFYDRLVNSEQPYITFQLLDLQGFGLSDDLYIKMNARGKPLTIFEAFKARLEQHLETSFPGEKHELHGTHVSIKRYFSHQIDTAWADLFWQYRDFQTSLYDDSFMHLVRVLAVITRVPGSAEYDYSKVVLDLRNREESFSFLRYQGGQCLDRPLIETLVGVLDEWCGASEGIRTHLPDMGPFDERRSFEKVIKSSPELTYEELVQFHAYCAYIIKNRNGLPAACFGEWMRVIVNLTVNTTYDTVDDLGRSIQSVNELLNESNRILDHLSDTNVEVQGFNKQQIREERLKAQLIRKSDEWAPLIQIAEQHGYFRGQIEFLFKFSGVLDRWLVGYSSDWSIQEDVGYREAFAGYFAKASTVFSAKGLNDFGEYRWERALLSIGDYLLHIGRNHSFLKDSDRDLSWKRLLRGAIEPNELGEKREYIKELLDQIDLNKGIRESLDSVISLANPKDEWRRIIIARPEIIHFCGKRMIRIVSQNCVYLLRKIRMSGEHANLFTYHLKVGLLSDKHERGDLSPFAEPVYHMVNTDSEEPFVRLEWIRDDGIIDMNVSSSKDKDGAYELKLFDCDGKFPAKLMAGLTSNPAFQAVDGALLRTVDRGEIEEAIDEVVNAVRNFANKSTP